MATMLIFLIIVALIATYFHLTENMNYWQKCKVPCANGALPGIGHFWDFLTMKTTFSECCRKIYKDNRDRSMVGVYNFRSPALMVLEPELVKTVMHTNFTNFHENGFKIDPNLDPILANNPAFAYGDKWTNSRKRFTHAFTPIRLKLLLRIVNQVCEKFENFLDTKLSRVKKVEMELKDLFGKFTAQVVFDAAFGVDGLCFDDEKEHESFYTKGKLFLDSFTFNDIILIFGFFIPLLGKIVKVPFFPKRADHFFRSIIDNVMRQRRTEKTLRKDFLQSIMEVEQIECNKHNLETFTSHAVSFFINGHQTSSTVLSYIGFQLASHPDVQEKLREEVVSVLSKYDNVITYEALKEMTYMDQVFNESQRMIPALGLLTKICTEELELRGTDGVTCRVQPGTQILIPVHGLQEDPRYWENPEVFDPERFGPDRKHSIPKYAFLPFGEGPRSCVGMRMAQMQMKACMATMLRKYSLELSSKTQLPLKITGTFFISAAEGGIWVFIRPI